MLIEWKTLWAVICGWVLAILSILFGAPNLTLVGSFAILVIIDWITGVAAAMYLGKFQSALGIAGFMKKCIIFLMLSAMYHVDLIFGGTLLFRVGLFILTFFEAMSILENLYKLDRIPQWLRNTLQKILSASLNGMLPDEAKNVTEQEDITKISKKKSAKKTKKEIGE